MESTFANAEAVGDDYTVAFIAQALGEGYTQLGDFESAKQYLDTALDYYRRNDMRPYLARALQSLVYWYEQQGRGEEAEQARTEAQPADGRAAPATGSAAQHLTTAGPQLDGERESHRRTARSRWARNPLQGTLHRASARHSTRVGCCWVSTRPPPPPASEPGCVGLLKQPAPV